MTKRSRAREVALQLLFQRDHNSGVSTDAVKQFVENRLRDALNPDSLLSPGKLLPTAGACGMEQVHPGRRAPL